MRARRASYGLLEAIESMPIGSSQPITIERDNKRITLALTIEAAP